MSPETGRFLAAFFSSPFGAIFLTGLVFVLAPAVRRIRPYTIFRKGGVPMKDPTPDNDKNSPDNSIGWLPCAFGLAGCYLALLGFFAKLYDLGIDTPEGFVDFMFAEFPVSVVVIVVILAVAYLLVNWIDDFAYRMRIEGWLRVSLIFAGALYFMPGANPTIGIVHALVRESPKSAEAAAVVEAKDYSNYATVFDSEVLATSKARVYKVIAFKGGKAINGGTGIMVSPNMLAVSWSTILEGNQKVDEVLVCGLEEASAAATCQSRGFWATYRQSSSKLGVAIMELPPKSNSGEQRPTGYFGLAVGVPITSNSSIAVIGYPRIAAVTGDFLQSSLTTEFSNISGGAEGNGARYFIVGRGIVARGMLGAPMVLPTGEVAGIITGYNADDQAKANAGFALDARYVACTFREFLIKDGAVVPPCDQLEESCWNVMGQTYPKSTATNPLLDGGVRNEDKTQLLEISAQCGNAEGVGVVISLFADAKAEKPLRTLADITKAAGIVRAGPVDVTDLKGKTLWVSVAVTGKRPSGLTKVLVRQ